MVFTHARQYAAFFRHFITLQYIRLLLIEKQIGNLCFKIITIFRFVAKRFDSDFYSLQWCRHHSTQTIVPITKKIMRTRSANSQQNISSVRLESFNSQIKKYRTVGFKKRTDGKIRTILNCQKCSKPFCSTSTLRNHHKEIHGPVSFT